MSNQVELEYKVILKKRQFMKIKRNYAFALPFKQVNHYYDDDLRSLKKKRFNLRIREVDNKYLVTLKTPNDIGVMEYECESDSLDIKNCFLSEDIKAQLAFIDVNSLNEYGTLTTYRSIYELDEAYLCLDENFYENNHDYELEYEVKINNNSLSKFKHLLFKNGIKKYIPAMGKAQRLRKALRI